MNVRTLCLGALTFGDATGYEIKKMAEEGLFSHFIEASYGSIYPALTKMTEEGLLTFRTENQDGKPDKKVYSITPLGRDELRQALTTFPKKDKFKSEFLFIMLLSEHLDQSHVRRVLAQRTQELAEELAMIEACGLAAESPGTKFVNGYGQAVIGAAFDYMRAQAEFSNSTDQQTLPPSQAAE
ncbi:MAG: PadR family transcriptional regulator [Hyphomicrobiales bacterium]